MRRSYNSQVLFHDGIFVGIDFGYDFCAEHEFGITEIRKAFGLNENFIGLKHYQNNKVPSGRQIRLQRDSFIKNKMNWCGLYFNAEYFGGKDEKIKNFLPLPYKYTEDELCTAWNSCSFGFVVHKTQSWVIDDIMNAIKNFDLIIGTDNFPPFKQGGLKLLIASRMPMHAEYELRAFHEDCINLTKEVDLIGIEAFLAKHNKKFYALAPQWYSPTFKPNNRTLKTKYKVIFFLNPQNQSKYNSGWFTVEELIEWTQEKGIVVR